MSCASRRRRAPAPGGDSCPAPWPTGMAPSPRLRGRALEHLDEVGAEIGHRHRRRPQRAPERRAVSRLSRSDTAAASNLRRCHRCRWNRCGGLYLGGFDSKGTAWRSASRRRRGERAAARRRPSGSGLEPGRPLRRPGRSADRGRPRASEAEAASELEAEYKGRLAELDGDGLADADPALRGARGSASAALSSFAQLLFAANRDDPEIGRFFQGIQERITTIGTKLLFVTLELNKLEDARAGGEDRGLASGCSTTGPGCDTVRSYRPHQLADAVERTLHEKYVTGRSAWVRLFDETHGGLALPVRRQGADQRRDLRPAVGQGPRGARAGRGRDQRCARARMSGCSAGS